MSSIIGRATDLRKDRSFQIGAAIAVVLTLVIRFGVDFSWTISILLAITVTVMGALIGNDVILRRQGRDDERQQRVIINERKRAQIEAEGKEAKAANVS